MSAPHPGMSPDRSGHEQPHGAPDPRGPVDCSEVLLRLYEYLDQEMAGLDRERVRAHLDECGGCMSSYERDLVLKGLVRRCCTPEPAPERLRMSIMVQLTTVEIEYPDA